MTSKVLVPFIGEILPARLVILIVGPWSKGRNDLITGLSECKEGCNVCVYTSIKLPLPKRVKDCIDYIVFMLDTSNKHSLTDIETSLKFVDVRYFAASKCCFAISNPGDRKTHNIDLGTLIEFVKERESKLINFDPNNPRSVSTAALSICKLAKIASNMGPTRHVTPGFILGSRVHVE